MAHVGRSLGVVVVGWGTGFLIALAWGATRVNNPRLTSVLSGWAIAGMVVIGVLLLSIVVRDRTEHLGETRTSADPPRITDEPPRATRKPRRPRAAAPHTTDQSHAATARAARAAAAAEKRSAARIAELEARLAREQEELDAAVASLAATELAETGHITGGMGDPDPDPAAAELEPVLRQEVVDVVAELVGRVEPGKTAALAEELAARLEKAP